MWEKCVGCGEGLFAGDAFCGNCGRPVTAAVPAAREPDGLESAPLAVPAADLVQVRLAPARPPPAPSRTVPAGPALPPSQQAESGPADSGPAGSEQAASEQAASAQAAPPGQAQTAV